MPGASIDRRRQQMTVSQSALATFQRCPEQARYELVAPARRHNDALATGQAVHLHAAGRLEGESFPVAYAKAYAWLDAEWQRDGFEWVKVKTPETMFGHFDACVQGWERHVLRQIPAHGQVETTLSFPLGEPDDEGWQVILEGTPDYVAEGTVWDWKTAASEYNAWESAEWAIQPTSYTYLASRAYGEDVTDFTYAVMVKPRGQVQMIDVERGPNDWAWLARIAHSYMTMARDMLDVPWPVIHTHHLCDPKWCPYWDGCRGSYMRGDQPIQLRRHQHES